MEEIDRRRFLKLVSGGSGAVALGVMLPTKDLLSTKRLLSPTSKDLFTFRAVAGIPQGPFPSYASYVVQGTVNLTTRSGIITKTVFAGPPELMSTIALPGLSRIVRVTDVRDAGDYLEVRGTIDDRSQLHAGETPTVDIQIYRSRGIASARFVGSQIKLKLET